MPTDTPWLGLLWHPDAEALTIRTNSTGPQLHFESARNDNARISLGMQV